MVKMLQISKKMAHLIGPFLFIIILLTPFDLSNSQQKFLAIFSLVMSNWLFTNIPLFISGLMGVCLTTLMGLSSATDALSHFASPIIFLFLGGFLFARAMHKVELDKRISLNLLSRRFIDGKFNRLLLTLFSLTAFFSMWVSNTATTAMMLPIILGTLDGLKIEDKEITSIILLGMAYSASVGGLGTPIGSPPNIIAIGLLKELSNIHVSFLDWTLIGIPFVCIFILIIYQYICFKLPKDLNTFNNSFILNEKNKLPKIQVNEYIIIILFCLTIFFWFAPSIASMLFSQSSPLVTFFQTRFNSGIVAIFFTSFLFIFPLGNERKILINDDIKRIDWGSLLLFGSGLSLGKILFSTGLAKIAGNFLISNLTGGFLLLTFLVIIYFAIFSTELASNTASANILLPIVIAMSIQLNITPFLLVVAVALSCSLAFMLPVATPPNAIVYGSEKVEMRTMVKMGFFLNLLFGLIISIVFFILTYLY